MNNFLNNIAVKTGNFWSDININSAILSAIVLSVPVLIAILIPIFKAKLGLKSSLFLYSFTTGFFVVLGLFGEANEGRELAMDAAHDDSWVQIGNQMLVLLVGGAIGLGFAILVKFLVSRKLGKLNFSGPVENHSDHIAFHNHPHAEEVLFGGKGLKYESQKEMARAKVVAIYLVLSHRFAAGFFLGYTIFNIVSPNHPEMFPVVTGEEGHSHSDSVSLAFLIGFFLHLIPEELIIYYRQREMGISKIRAAVYSVLMVSVLVPFIFLGANIGQYVHDVWQLNGIIHVIVGVLFTFTALVEFFPEVIREATNQKLWYLTIACLTAGILVCFFVLSFGA